MPISFFMPDMQQKTLCAGNRGRKSSQVPLRRAANDPCTREPSRGSTACGSTTCGSGRSTHAARQRCHEQATLPLRKIQPPVHRRRDFNPEFKIQCMQCGTAYPMQPHLVGQNGRVSVRSPFAIRRPTWAPED